MPNAFVNTGTGSFGNSSAVGTYGTAGLLQRAYDKVLDFKLRSEPMFRTLADKKPGSLTNNSNQVLFQIYQDLAVTNSALAEDSDPDTIGMSTPDHVAVNMVEYGNMVARTKALKLFSFTDVDPAIANIVAYNMIDTIDTLVNSVLIGGDNVLYSGNATSTATVDSADIFSSAQIRKAITKLRAGKAVPRKGSLYACYLHPEVSHDLRAETGAASWRLPHEYQTNENLWAGEIGNWEGAYFVETPRAFTAIDGADGTALSTSPAVSGVSGAFTIVVANGAFGGLAKVGDKISGTNVGTGAKITAISVGASNTTLTVSVANSGTVGTATLTVTPVAKVYRTIVAGRQALAEAVAEEPHTVIGTVTDPLKRYRPIGWYGVLGFARYREEALYRLETTSDFA
jgi:N4-gp56 family major capsid protein